MIDIPIGSILVFDNKVQHCGAGYPGYNNARIFWALRRGSNDGARRFKENSTALSEEVIIDEKGEVKIFTSTVL